MHGSEKRGGVELEPHPDQDFVMRQIRQVVDLISRLLLGRPSAAEVDEAQQRLRQVAHDALRIDLDLLVRVAPESVLQVLGSPARIAAYLEVLEAQVTLARAAGDGAGAARLARRASELRSLIARR